MKINLSIFAAICISLVTTQLRADVFHLKHGDKIHGKLLKKEEVGRKTYLVIKTEFGDVLKLEKSKFVEKHYVDDELTRTYRQKFSQIGDTADEHRSAYDWCKEKDDHRFRDQMDYHLLRIVELDPSDKWARNRLNFRNDNGRWVNDDRVLAGNGYEKVKGKWVSNLMAEVNRKRGVVDEEVNARKSALERWRKNTLKKKPVSDVQKELFDIVDEKSVNVIAGKNFLGKAKNNPGLRKLYLDAIGRVQSNAALSILVQYAMVDPDESVRDRAISLLMNQELYAPAVAASKVAAYLRNTSNVVVRRAGSALRELKSPTVILPLIDGLNTTHKEATGNQPGRMTVGQGPGGGGLNMGGGPTHRINDYRNDEVLEALRTITKNDFGFSEERWKNWYVENHTITRYDFRRDE